MSYVVDCVIGIFLGELLLSMGYSATTWQFYAVFGLAALWVLSHAWRR